MENRKSIVCIFVMVAVCMASALPILNTDDENIPWAHPCTPNKQASRVKKSSRLSDFEIDSLKEKVEDTVMLVDDLLGILEEKYFADSEVIASLRKSPVKNFPVVKESEQQEGIYVYRDHFSHLSKAAVFLESIENDEDEYLQSGFNILFRGNLHQMCELDLALTRQNVKLPLPASRSIMSQELRKPGSAFKRYETDYKILYLYKLLLENNLAQYEHIPKQ